MSARVNCVVVLDQPERTHYGSEDAVTGHVQLTGYPGTKTTSTELFGPLKISLDFCGRAKSKIWVNNGQSTSIYRGRAPLFSKRAVIFDQAFRGEFGKPYNFPFQTRFPSSVELGQGIFQDKGDSVYHALPGHLLPPTMHSFSRGLGHHFECFVTYVIQGHVAMPGIGVDVNKITEVNVTYSPEGTYAAPLTSPPKTGQHCIVQNKHLLPVQERPKGFKENTKAMFKSDYYPKFCFGAMATIPNHFQIGGKPRVTVQIEQNLDLSDVETVPHVELRHVTIKLKAVTSVRAEPTFFGERTGQGSETVYVSGLVCRNARFRAEKNWTVDVQGNEVPTSVQPSFATYNIARAYELDVDVRLICAEKEFRLHRRCMVTVLPCNASRMDGLGQAGSSRVPTYEEIEQLPSYADAPNNELLESAPAPQTPPPVEGSSTKGGA